MREKKVEIGDIIIAKDREANHLTIYEITQGFGSSFFTNALSPHTSLGKAFIGSKIGDLVRVDAQASLEERNFEVIDIPSRDSFVHLTGCY